VDVTYGNMTVEEAQRLAWAVGDFPDEVEHEPGCTEPWISKLVADFTVARGARTVLETGCFKGATSVWIVEALEALGGGAFFGCEVDMARQIAVRKRLGDPSRVEVSMHGDVLAFLFHTTARFDLAFVDDEHTKPHVTKELMLLMPKMNKGGLILLHDVFGVCDLKTVVQQFGGYSIDLPRLGPAGGLGLIQC
jgi:hypothetical protein